MAAIVFGAESFYQYLYSKKVIVETDLKPLITIINNPLCKAPARCQRLLLRLQAFELQPKYVPGKPFLMGQINNFTISLELTTETTASKCLYFLVFITIYILFCFSYKSIFIVEIFVIKIFIFTIITHKHSVKYRERERERERDGDAAKLKRAESSVAN